MNREDLHEYQNYSVDFIKKNPIVALLLSCGLGKTVTTLTAINDLMFDDFEISKVLGKDEKSTDNALQRLKSKIRRAIRNRQE